MLKEMPRVLGSWLPGPLLYCYCSPHIGPSGYMRPRITRRIRSCWRLSNDVHQNLAHLSRAGSDSVSLLILKGINLPFQIERKDHWFRISHEPLPRADRTIL